MLRGLPPGTLPNCNVQTPRGPLKPSSIAAGIYWRTTNCWCVADSSCEFLRWPLATDDSPAVGAADYAGCAVCPGQLPCARCRAAARTHRGSPHLPRRGGALCAAAGALHGR